MRGIPGRRKIVARPPLPGYAGFSADTPYGYPVGLEGFSNGSMGSVVSMAITHSRTPLALALVAALALLWCQVEHVGHHPTDGAADTGTPLAHAHESAGGMNHSHSPDPPPAGEQDRYPDSDCEFSVTLQSERLVSIAFTVDKAVQATIPSIDNLFALQHSAIKVAATHASPPLLFRSPVARRVLIRI